MLLVAGIDPGRDGGITILNEKGAIITTKPLRTVVVKDFMYQHNCKILWIEKAQPMGKESSMAMFNYGREYGFLLGTLSGSGIDVNFVPPSVWTAKLHQKSAVAMVHKKSASENAAKQLWPNETFLINERCRKPHDGLYESALIAYYGLCQELSTISNSKKDFN